MEYHNLDHFPLFSSYDEHPCGYRIDVFQRKCHLRSYQMYPASIDEDKSVRF